MVSMDRANSLLSEIEYEIIADSRDLGLKQSPYPLPTPDFFPLFCLPPRTLQTTPPIPVPCRRFGTPPLIIKMFRICTVPRKLKLARHCLFEMRKQMASRQLVYSLHFISGTSA
ncbi:hypothetical protein EVAR_66159_1 [Eumeta japonica]|uniref:Uncharacterized protein n=1 Tax=Eumeta variegata TaxID=151549 RepID=A0A4C1ZPG7_EUMVA|nr:hypothetical protein EVAR_66159_1 [Eumeta japonica]